MVFYHLVTVGTPGGKRTDGYLLPRRHDDVPHKPFLYNVFIDEIIEKRYQREDRMSSEGKRREPPPDNRSKLEYYCPFLEVKPSPLGDSSLFGPDRELDRVCQCGVGREVREL